MFRPVLLLTPLVAAGLSLAALAPAQAEPAPITDLSASAVQTPGSHTAWTVSGSWTANSGPTTYVVKIVDSETGTGTAYETKDTSGTTVSIVTDKLESDTDYWLAVSSKTAGSSVVTKEFHTPTLDTTAPKGTYKTDRLSSYLVTGTTTADFQISQTSLDDATATRSVVPGDGSAALAWPTGGTITVHYAKPGSFTPHVVLTDGFGNSSDIALPAVQVLKDGIAPRITISLPAKPTKASSWRVVRGTASDAQTGVSLIGAFVLEKRGATWWMYDFSKRKWVKGYTTPGKTMNKTKAFPALTSTDSRGGWRTPAVKGLTRGTIRVEAAAFDDEGNYREVAVARKVR